MNDLLSNPLIPARDYVAIRINSPAPAGEDENQPPSGQDETNQPAGSSNNGAGSSQEEDDFESLGLLTQYIGPPVATADQTTVHRTNPDEREIDRITAEFKSKYENLVDSLDRAKGHRTSLGQAKQRGRTPAKLQISIRPMVVNRENPKFQGNWERAVKQSEGILLDTLINHLDSFIQSTNEKIRNEAKDTWQRIKQIDASRAATLLQEALQQCEENRKAKAETRKRKREEALKKTTTKKNKTNDN